VDLPAVALLVVALLVADLVAAVVALGSKVRLMCKLII
jgi:hypothetical protein